MTKELKMSDKPKKQDVIDDLETLAEFLNDRISELHKVIGGQLERQVLFLYRRLVWRVQNYFEE